ncbi:subtilisin family serine protease [Inhella inkyongensis]|uniref:Subtilisin family serine protease n=1 Tax=Inhella inkyongensis TaxID=392593 RepID=A0A840S2K6_9BURK|nr:S8 family serine peptidase [Inhella inkyongensis]MBB5205427.1 subtilisin family serine protease [Inhella inkyongensis]
MALKKNLIHSLVAAACAAAALPAMAADYVLQAAQWGAAQDAAVQAAGGKARFSHASGVAVVESERADFLSQVLASGAIQSGAPDRVAQFTPNVKSFDMPVDASGVPAVISDAFYPYIQWAPQSVKAPQAWGLGYTGKGVRVAVIDGAVWGSHPDLAANVDTAAARSFVAGAPGSCQVKWDCDTGTAWHGTHVAGIIAAPANGLGVVGIAPEATIVPVKALHSGSGSFGAIISAILYAAGEGRADIINMSLGADFNRGDRDAAELVAAMNKAINTATRQGVLVISAAGNDGYDLDHSGNLITTPAMSGNGLAVSSTGPLGFAMGATNTRRISSYTNYGSSMISVAAPGGDFALEGNAPCMLPRANGSPVVIPCWAFDMVISTVRGSGGPGTGSYSWMAGTSMAAPAASAVAALIKQKYPGASVGALKNMLMNSTDDEGKKGHDPYYGRGFVNALKAVSQ